MDIKKQDELAEQAVEMVIQSIDDLIEVLDTKHEAQLITALEGVKVLLQS